MNKLPELIDAICLAWTKCLPPPYGDGAFSSAIDGQTDCNRFTQMVAEMAFGYVKFKRFNANDMVRYMSDHPEEWMELSDGSVAQFHANNGALVIPGWANPNLADHGHVCVVRPGQAEPSGSWGIETASVPKVANVSIPNYCKIDAKASYAFGPNRRPRYFVLKSTILDT